MAKNLAPALGGWLDACPQLAWTEVVNHGGESSHVVGVAVREDHYVEPLNLAEPQIGRDHFLADIHLGSLFPRHSLGARKTACVDEHGGSTGKNHQQAVALTDVKAGNLEPAGKHALKPARARDKRREREPPPHTLSPESTGFSAGGRWRASPAPRQNRLRIEAEHP